MLLFGPLGANLDKILSEIHTFSFTKKHLKTASAKWRPFCLGLSLPLDIEYNPWNVHMVVFCFASFWWYRFFSFLQYIYMHHGCIMATSMVTSAQCQWSKLKNMNKIGRKINTATKTNCSHGHLSCYLEYSFHHYTKIIAQKSLWKGWERNRKTPSNTTQPFTMNICILNHQCSDFRGFLWCFRVVIDQ